MTNTTETSTLSPKVLLVDDNQQRMQNFVEFIEIVGWEVAGTLHITKVAELEQLLNELDTTFNLALIGSLFTQTDINMTNHLATKIKSHNPLSVIGGLSVKSGLQKRLDFQTGGSGAQLLLPEIRTKILTELEKKLILFIMESNQFGKIKQRTVQKLIQRLFPKAELQFLTLFVNELSELQRIAEVTPEFAYAFIASMRSLQLGNRTEEIAKQLTRVNPEGKIISVSSKTPKKGTNTHAHIGLNMLNGVKTVFNQN